MRAQIRGMHQAGRNAQDGISLIQTSEGYMGTITELSQRVRELLVQAGNDTYSENDRKTIRNEIHQLTQEINRILESATFNGQQLFGTASDDIGFTIDIDALAAANQTLADGAVAGGVWADLSADQVALIQTFLNGTVFANAVNNNTALAAADLAALVDNINAIDGTHDADAAGLLNFFNETREAIADALPQDPRPVTATDLAALDSPAIPSGLPEEPTAGQLAALAAWLSGAAGNDVMSNDPIDSAAITGADGWDATLAASFGILSPNGGTWDSSSDDNGIIALAAFLDGNRDAINAIINGKDQEDVDGVEFDEGPDPNALSPLLTSQFTLQVGPNTADWLRVDVISQVNEVVGSVQGLLDIPGRPGEVPQTIMTGDDARGALDTITDFLSIVSGLRAALGSFQNRIEFTIENLNISAENLAASESRIRDADMAREMMALTQANILQQAATSMLAQANQAPQSILQLLQ
jgi:flagellin